MCYDYARDLWSSRLHAGEERTDKSNRDRRIARYWLTKEPLFGSREDDGDLVWAERRTAALNARLGSAAALSIPDHAFEEASELPHLEERYFFTGNRYHSQCRNKHFEVIERG